jgi:acyl-coenzyme A synthetase/AMP-(fatty) acid ligase
MGFKFGDTLAVVLPNIPEFPLVMFGAIEAGLTVTTVNPAFTPGTLVVREILLHLRVERVRIYQSGESEDLSQLQ